MSIEDNIDKAIQEYEQALKENRFGPGADKAAARVRDLLAQRREQAHNRR